jgi:hypothetical protein
VIAYFLILGVVGTVRRLLEGGADFARGTNRLMGSVFNMSSVQFGQMMWLNTTDVLGPVLEAIAAAGAVARRSGADADATDLGADPPRRGRGGA